MKTKEEILKTCAGMTEEQISKASFYYSKSAMLSAMDEHAANNVKAAMDIVYGWLRPDAMTVEQDFVECDDLDELKEKFINKYLNPNVK